MQVFSCIAGECVKFLALFFVRIADYAENTEDAEGGFGDFRFFHNHQVLCNLKTEEIANFTPILTKTLCTKVTLW